MSLSTLKGSLPTTPEQFPDSSEVMPDDLRTDSFQPASTRLLQALTDVSKMGGRLPEGWIDLEREAPMDDGRALSIVSPEQRIHVGTAVFDSPGANDEAVVVNGLVRLFDGDDELEVIEKAGVKAVNDQGIPNINVVFRGVLGGNGNPYFNRSGVDCEPELQHLSLALEYHRGSATDVVWDGVAGKHFTFPVPHSVDYASYDKPPVGDEGIVDTAQMTADFLEGLAHGSGAQ